jgi:hypothetical protein
VTFMVARHPHGYRRLRASSTILPLSERRESGRE